MYDVKNKCYSLARYMGGNYANRKIEQEKRSYIEEHPKDYVLAKPKIINKFR